MPLAGTWPEERKLPTVSNLDMPLRTIASKVGCKGTLDSDQSFAYVASNDCFKGWLQGDVGFSPVVCARPELFLGTSPRRLSSCRVRATAKITGSQDGRCITLHSVH